MHVVHRKEASPFAQRSAMDQRFRVTVAVGVMLLGLLLSMAFRRTGNSAPLRSEPLVLRQQSATPAVLAPFAPAPLLPPLSTEPKHLAPAPFAPASNELPRTAAGAPVDASGTPLLAPAYPGPADANSAMQMSAGNAETFPKFGRPARKITHRIVDGDSLAELAERYLGSASRAPEIFEANRDVLFSPQLLPIGAELKMPVASLR